ncbi:MAG: SDR family NAD(P)-dependent oxidoreductase [Rhodospirillales bacterium]|nr:SDR family NAD(P)-dependent oxidoreductase [Rhodospirillales bacterium]
MSELSGQVAIVTGGASGIGAAAAVLLQDAGATVIVADLQQVKAGAGHCHVGACEPFLASARAC